MAESIGGATEHQGNDTPHFHGVMAVTSPYQTKTLAQIRDLIKKDLSQVNLIKRFCEHMCREDHFDDAGHQENLPQLQKDWEGSQAGLPHA